MNKITYLLLGLLMALNFNISAQENWKRYDFLKFNFSIDFFQEPDFSIDTTSFNDFPLITYSHVLNVIDNAHKNINYSISQVAYPSDFIHSDSLFSVVEDFINSTQNGLIENENYSLLSSRILEKNGFPGKEFVWKTNDDIFFWFQVFLVENSLFQLSVIPRQGENHNFYIHRFLNSFELVGIPKGNFSKPAGILDKTIRIKFPAIPKEEIRTIDSEYGKLTMDIQILEPKSDDDNMIYIAMEARYPNKIIDQDNIYELNAFYKKSIDGVLKAANGELTSINDIYYKGKLGKEIRCFLSNGQVLMIYRFYFIEGNLFTIGVITKSDNDKNKAMNKFFKSFAIKNKWSK